MHSGDKVGICQSQLDLTPHMGHFVQSQTHTLPHTCKGAQYFVLSTHYYIHFYHQFGATPIIIKQQTQFTKDMMMIQRA